MVVGKKEKLESETYDEKFLAKRLNKLTMKEFMSWQALGRPIRTDLDEDDVFYKKLQEYNDIKEEQFKLSDWEQPEGLMLREDGDDVE